MGVSQQGFVEALLDPERPPPEGLTDPQGRPAGKRFDVYRNNVVVSLVKAMETGFPVIAKLIGRRAFAQAAGLFVRAHPPRDPVLMLYGADFPEFLASLPPLRHLPYLADVARLELARREAYHAADAGPIDGARLAALSADRLMAVRLRLVPALRLLRSDWPVLSIWRFNMVEDAPKPAPGAEAVLVTRPGFDVEMDPVSPGGAAFLAAVQAGATLERALEEAEAREEGFDLAPLLALLFARGAIVGLDFEREDDRDADAQTPS